MSEEIYDEEAQRAVEAICKERDELKARIAELEKELNIVQESERAEAREADRLRTEIKELEKKLTETVKLLGERSRECGELEAYNEVLQRRIREFSMELLDRTMEENKDVLERLKNWEEYLDKDISTQSTDAIDVRDNGKPLGYWDDTGRCNRSRRNAQKIGSHPRRAILKLRTHKEIISSYEYQNR